MRRGELSTAWDKINSLAGENRGAKKIFNELPANSLYVLRVDKSNVVDVWGSAGLHLLSRFRRTNGGDMTAPGFAPDPRGKEGLMGIAPVGGYGTKGKPAPEDMWE